MVHLNTMYYRLPIAGQRTDTQGIILGRIDDPVSMADIPEATCFSPANPLFIC